MSLLYSEIRNELQTGDLLAWKITKITSKIDLILYLNQKILGAKFSHVGILMRLGDRLFVVEASPPVVRIYPLSMCDDFYLIQTSLQPKDTHLNALFKHIGKKYDLTDLITGILKMKSDDTSLYCSELAQGFYKGIGYIEDEDAGLTPDTIVEAIEKRTGISPISVIVDRENLVSI